MKTGNLGIVPLMLVLMSCGTPAIVRFPADGQSAKLRYISSAARSDGTYLWRVDRSRCPAAAEPMLIATTGEKEKSPIDMLDTNSEPQALIRELNIPAAEPFTFYVYATGYPTYSCDNAGVFQPIPGRQYELRHVIEPTTSVCIVQVDELRQSADRQVTREREPSVHYFHPPKKQRDYCAEAPR